MVPRSTTAEAQIGCCGRSRICSLPIMGCVSSYTLCFLWFCQMLFSHFLLLSLISLKLWNLSIQRSWCHSAGTSLTGNSSSWISRLILPHFYAQAWKEFRRFTCQLLGILTLCLNAGLTLSAAGRHPILNALLFYTLWLMQRGTADWLAFIFWLSLIRSRNLSILCRKSQTF